MSEEFPFPPPEKVIAQDVPLDGMPAEVPVSGPPSISFSQPTVTEVTMESRGITVKVKSPDSLAEVASWADKLFSSHIGIAPQDNKMTSVGFSTP